MSDPLLATKFYFPAPRFEQVSRPRLIARLDESLNHKLTLVCAPAGYGKSTLVVEWISQIPQARIGWLSLDEGDNDPARFLNYLIAAAQKAQPGIAERALAMLYSPRMGGTKTLPAETLLNTLVNDLIQVPHPIVLILEDYHVIQAEAIHHYLAYLLDHLPANTHLLLTSRAEPALPLARLRGRGELVEIRATDLRFTDSESEAFLNHSMKLGLATDQVALLNSRTEGWIAGLLMAAMSMLRREDVTSFINDFTGSNRYIMDYLVEEVLQQQPETIQQFFHFTCPLDRLCGELCDEIMAEALEITGHSAREQTRPAAASILRWLERTNLFIVPLDDRQEWYRYHRLFADLLRKRLSLAYPKMAALIHHKASHWFERKGNLSEAIEHSFLAGDFEHAASLIEKAAVPILMRSETSLFLTWVEQLPEYLIQTRPSLGIFYALALIISSQKLEELGSRLDQVQAVARGDLDGEIATLRGLLMMLQGDIQGSIVLSHQALKQIPEERLLFKSLAADNLGMCYVLSGDMASAIQAFEEVISLAQRSGNIMMYASVLSNLAGLQIVQGHLRAAWDNYQKILDLSTDSSGRRLPVAGKALMGLGELAREWNDLEAAANYLSEAAGLLSQHVELGVIFCHISLARVRQNQGNWESTWELLSKAQQLASESRSIQMDDRLVEVAQAHFWILQGRYDQALSWAQKRNLDETGLVRIRNEAGLIGYDMIEPEYLCLARLWIAQGQADKALNILAHLQAIDEQKGRRRRLVEVLCLQAIALQAVGEVEASLTKLGQALAWAKPEGFIRAFIDEGESVLHLLTLARQRGIEAEYASRLIASMQVQGTPAQKLTKSSALPTSLPPSVTSRPALEIIEPLSQRELEVLQLLALGLSNSEIGAHLVISLSTVKGHTANIYSKLGVNSRSLAVAKARQIGLL